MAAITKEQYKRIYSIEGLLDYPIQDMEDIVKLLPSEIRNNNKKYILHITPYDVYYTEKDGGPILYLAKVVNFNYVDALIDILEHLSQNYYI